MAQTIESVDVSDVHGMVVLNPDGTAIGTPVGGATSANQTNGSQKTQIVDAGGEATTVTGGRLDVNAIATSGLSIPAYDYVSVAYTDADTETFTFKTGGSGGSTVATVVINYTDSTKANISNVTKT